MADDSIDTLDRATQPPANLMSMVPTSAPVIGAPQNPQPFTSYLRATLPANYSGSANSNNQFRNSVIPQISISSPYTPAVTNPRQAAAVSQNPSSITTVNKTQQLSMTQTNVVASRAFGTVYQNTTGLPLFVTLWFANSVTGGTLLVFCDSSSSPTLAVVEQSIGSNSFGVGRTATFLVPAGYYYKATADVAITQQSWIEYTLSLI